MAEAVELIRKAMEQLEEDAEGWFQLGAVGQRMQQPLPEFDTRTFGHAKLSDLVEATDRFEINRAGPHVRLRPKPGPPATLSRHLAANHPSGARTSPQPALRISCSREAVRANSKAPSPSG